MTEIAARGDTARANDWWRPRPQAAAVGAPAAAPAVDEGADLPAFRAIIAFTAILMLSPQEWLPVLRPLRIALLTAGIAVATYVGGRLTHHRSLGMFPREFKVTIAFVAWAVLTVPMSMHPGGSVLLLQDLYLKTLVVFWLLANTASSARRLRAVAWTISLTAIVPAITAVRNYASGNFMTGGTGLRIAGYESPLTNNPNDMALMLNLTLPLTVTLLGLTRRRPLRALLMGIIGLELIAIVLTFSRGGSIALGVILITLLWRFSKRRGAGLAVAVAALAVVIVPLLPASYLDRLSSIDNIDQDTTGSAQERWNISVAAAKYIVAHPVIGTGIGVNVLAINQMLGEHWTEVHNVYLEVGMELGLPGLALFLVLVIGCLRAAHQAQRATAAVPGAEELSELAGAIKLSLIAFIVSGFFHPSAYHVYFYYFGALALAARVAAQPYAQAAAVRR